MGHIVFARRRRRILWRIMWRAVEASKRFMNEVNLCIYVPASLHKALNSFLNWIFTSLTLSHTAHRLGDFFKAHKVTTPLTTDFLLYLVKSRNLSIPLVFYLWFTWSFLNIMKCYDSHRDMWTSAFNQNGSESIDWHLDDGNRVCKRKVYWILYVKFRCYSSVHSRRLFVESSTIFLTLLLCVCFHSIVVEGFFEKSLYGWCRANAHNFLII